MEKYYFSKHKTWIYLVTIVVMIILFATSIVNILALCGTANMISSSPVLDITATIIMLIVCIILVVFVFCSGYAICSNSIRINIGFYFSKVKYDEVLLIRMTSKKDLILLYKQTENQNSDVYDVENNLRADIIPVCISCKQADEFISNIKKHSPNVVIEIIPNEENK